MKLLVATDHRFVSAGEQVRDAYCFDRRFFDDYRKVFDHVVVAARVRDDPVAAEAAARADGDGVEFLRLPDVGGARWTAAPARVHLGALRAAVREADAVCVRIPSVAGWHAARLAGRSGRPVMFELIGDPMAALDASDHGRLRSAFGALDARRMRRITATAVAGSYVSRRHLQAAYPPGPATVVDSISSIRLAPGDVTEARATLDAPPDPLRVVLVASLVPVKRHDVLLRAAANARRRGTPVELELVGGGPLRTPLEQLARELGLERCTTFHGHLTGRPAIDAILDRSHVFAMTSSSEGMPRSMIEAMARGLPAVGTAAGGIAELLGAAELVPPGDHVSLGALLAELHGDPVRLAALSARSVATAHEFTTDLLSARRVALLEHLRAAASGEAAGQLPRTA